MSRSFRSVEQRVDRLVALRCETGVIVLQRGMGIPGLPGSVIDLHIANPPLREAAGEKILLALLVVAIHLAGLLALPGNIEGVEGFRLHPEREFQRFDPGLELGTLRKPFRVGPIQLLDETELLALLAVIEIAVLNVGDQFLGIGVLTVDVGALVDPRQKGVSPVAGLGGGEPLGTEDDKSRQTLVLRSQSVEQPGTHARFGDRDAARIHREKAPVRDSGCR